MELPEGYKVIDQPKERSNDGGCMGETVKQWYCTVQTPAGQKLFATGQGRDDVEFKIKKLVAEHATYEAASTRAKLRILVEKGKANNGLLSRDLSAAVLLMAEIVLGGEP